MTFEIHSDITNRSMTIASRAMRKVLRRKRSILWAIFDWSVFFINALLLIPFDGEPFTLDAGTVISLLVEVMLLSVLLFQDRLNGMIACKNTIQDRKYYLLVEELDKARKQVRDNFGTFDTIKANKLNKKLKKKSNALKNHVLEMNDKFSGEFAFFVDSKGNRTIEYIENDNIN